MNIIGRCYLCQDKTKFQNTMLCTKCFCITQDYRFSGCSRCGRTSCGGCDNIAHFHKVTSLYSYKDHLAKILVQAKADNHIFAKKVFVELFRSVFIQTILSLNKENKYDYIILSPLRKDRILNSGWHPNIFFYDTLLEIKSYLQNTSILVPYYNKNKKKQSLIPAANRKMIKSNIMEVVYNEFHLKNDLILEKKILLIDDVLTSGESSTLCKKLSENIFIDCSWDLLTLLRATTH